MASEINNSYLTLYNPLYYVDYCSLVITYYLIVNYCT